MEEIKTLGCKVAIDDFGTGYSNFEHLLKMNVNYLKIDASLIKNITKDENSRKITKTIVEFAKSLNLKTIAEFVENKEIFDMAKDLGVDYSQGYYFSAPIEKPNINEF
ncbi:EAL domain-containing protein [Aliarcobacter butzleri]|uniref:EAL domain-containing protein n=1 Tax=Aliarcobacter butzleri TaxID=28197 RepID=UPI002B255CF1|nr:EAL domain-containing protein [Aliarcobacter butzleri]